MGDDRVSHATRTAQEEATAAALAFVREGVLVCDIGWRVILANEGAGRLVGVRLEDLPGRDLRAVLPAAGTERVGEVLRRAAAGEGGEVAIRLEPDERWLHLRCEPQAAGGVVCCLDEVSERRRWAVEEAQMREQLHQARRMAALGRLAGGVSHDFNNMLSVILANTAMALDRVEAGSGVHRHLMEIRGAAARSVEINRHLRAFARDEPATPRVLDVNESVTETLGLLESLVGDGIALHWQPSAGLPPVRLDPTHLGQMLILLCADACEEMSGVGSITLATDAIAVAGTAGQVSLTLRHSGRGATGAGTATGLAMVEAMVGRLDGRVEVERDPVLGTTVHLPAREPGEGDPDPAADTGEPPVGGDETLLIVDDETSILKIAQRMLEALGYTVLPAAGPAHALRLAQHYSGPIHLLLTDVIMPEMGGHDLVPKIQALHPGIRVVYMSGYPLHLIANLVVLDAGLPLLAKPFSFPDLAGKIRTVLDGD
jgi:signal transduction histidine kinase